MELVRLLAHVDKGHVGLVSLLGQNSINKFPVMIIGGIYIGKNSDKKGFLEGMKIGIAVIIILFIFSYLAFDKSFSISSLFFYIIILISAILGSILGINKKSSN